MRFTDSHENRADALSRAESRVLLETKKLEFISTYFFQYMEDIISLYWVTLSKYQTNHFDYSSHCQLISKLDLLEVALNYIKCLKECLLSACSLGLSCWVYYSVLPSTLHSTTRKPRSITANAVLYAPSPSSPSTPSTLEPFQVIGGPECVPQVTVAMSSQALHFSMETKIFWLSRLVRLERLNGPQP